MPHLKDLTVEWVSLVDRAAVRDPSNPTQPQPFLLFKAERGGPTTPGGSMTPEETAAALQKAEAERDELKAKVEKLERKAAKKAEKTDPKPAQIDKSALPAPVREALEKAEKQAKENAERLEKAENLAKEERDLRVTREFVAKAESEFSHVGGDSNEFGALLKSASEKLTKEEFDALQTRLRAAEEQVKTSSLFKQAGVGGDPTPTDGSTDMAELQRKAQELRKADSGLSEYEAMHRVMAGDREAQARYLASIR